jgi:hypothetical protein
MQAFQLPHLSEYHRPRVCSCASRGWHVAVAHPFRLGPKFVNVGLSHGQHLLLCPAYVSRKKKELASIPFVASKNAMG